ncbi:MAG: hypothetical protein AAGB05_08325 [Pseudomonadota bacterium]
MPFAILLSLGLSLLIAISMARQLPFRGGKLVALVAASVLGGIAATLVTSADATAAFAAAFVGATIGVILTPRD